MDADQVCRIILGPHFNNEPGTEEIFMLLNIPNQIQGTKKAETENKR